MLAREVSCEIEANNVNSHTQYGVEMLVGTIYKYWRMCTESYL